MRERKPTTSVRCFFRAKALAFLGVPLVRTPRLADRGLWCALSRRKDEAAAANLPADGRETARSVGPQSARGQ